MKSSVEPFSDPLTEWNLTIGEIVAPFGLTGEMKVRLETDFPERSPDCDRSVFAGRQVTLACTR